MQVFVLRLPKNCAKTAVQIFPGENATLFAASFTRTWHASFKKKKKQSMCTERYIEKTGLFYCISLKNILLNMLFLRVSVFFFISNIQLYKHHVAVLSLIRSIVINKPVNILFN